MAPDATDCWQWDVESQLHAADLSRFASPIESIVGAELSSASALRLRTLLAREHLVREQALRVLRDVFRFELSDLAVLLVREDDDWADDTWPPSDG